MRKSSKVFVGMDVHKESIDITLVEIGARWAFTIFATALSMRWASCRSSAWVPLLCLSALLGSFTPSMANICRPIKPWRSQVRSTRVKIADASLCGLQ